MKKTPEPKLYEKNVHFWLRKIFYFVTELPESTTVDVTNDPDDPHPRKGELRELEMREDLKKHLVPWKPEKITQPEAEEACEKLYEMFNVPLDKELIRIIEDPYCAGAKPRRRTG